MKLSKSGKYVEFKNGMAIGLDSIVFAILFLIFLGALIIDIIY